VSDVTTPTVGELLRTAATRHPEREAFVHEDARITYAELDRAADGFAATLAGLGVGKGDRVCLVMGSSIAFATAYHGILRTGAITAAINVRLGATEQRSIFERTEPVVTVVGTGVELPDGVDAGTIVAEADLPAAFAAEPRSDLPAVTATDPACIVWTSGTTGVPKGAVYDHEAMAVISRNIGELTHDADRRLFVLPFPHVGYMTRVWDEVAHGTTIVLPGEPWSAEKTLRLVRDEGITMATGVPTQWALVLAHPDLERTDFSQLRVAATGAASIAPELVHRMRKVLGCPVITRYTSTEAGVTTSTLAEDSDEVIATTVGRPTPDVELRIVDVETGAELGPEAVGEIWSRSPGMMRGYWRDPERTAEVVDADGWLHTGDLGVVGHDGNLRIVGRLKEMYIRGGYNVYPVEVEAALAEHPAVDRVAVVGGPDPVLGEIGYAYVVPVAGTEPTLDALRTWCKDRIADYKAPDRLELLDELPLTSMLKIDKRALVARATDTDPEVR
jgi:acyl-CoA synthetase (AMP-forming)/AMP-acid ligase II